MDNQEIVRLRGDHMHFYTVDEEEIEKNSLHIPEEVIRDYEDRRLINCRMNSKTLEFLENNVIDFLVIPQDDSSPFGYTAKDQKIILKEIKEKIFE